MIDTQANLEDRLFSQGYAHISGLLDAEGALALRAMYEDDSLFRSRIVMEHHHYGSGEYKYFAYPLPEQVREIRERLYAELAPIANRWNDQLRLPQRYPADQQQYLFECREHGQSRPTALLLRYRPGDYNCLHQDTYGELRVPVSSDVFSKRSKRIYRRGNRAGGAAAAIAKPADRHFARARRLPHHP